MSSGILKLARLNPSFAKLLGCIYVLLGVGMLGALNAGEGSLVDDTTGDGFLGFLAGAAGGMSLLLVVALLGAIFAGTDVTPAPQEARQSVVLWTRLQRGAFACGHALAHVLLAAGIVWAALALPGGALAIWAVSLVVLFAAGSLVGTTIFALALLAVHRWRGAKASANTNRKPTAATRRWPTYTSFQDVTMCTGLRRGNHDWYPSHAGLHGTDARGPRVGVRVHLGRHSVVGRRPA